MTVFFTHEPVVNKSCTITANRLIVHEKSMDDACDALQDVAKEWPMERMVMLGLDGVLPDSALADWQLPSNTLVELSSEFLADPEGGQLAQHLAQNGTGVCVSGISEG